jgi:hypothetical protein
MTRAYKHKILTVCSLLLDNEPISGSHFSSFLHILPVKQYNGLNFNENYENYSTVNACGLAIFQIFNFIGSSVIYLSLSEIPYGLTRGNLS